MEADFYLPPKFSLESPYLSEYFGIWNVHGPTFRGMAEKCNGINLHAHLQSSEVRQSVESRDNRLYPVTKDGIAVFRVSGPMMKQVPSMADGTSTVRLRQQVRAARKDQEVLGGFLVMDTPGGTVRGNEDLAADVAAFASEKPLYVFVEDMCCSAGVSVASSATKRFANIDSAMYGSMGTFAVIQDLSGMAEKLGIVVHVIKAGAHKGAGVPGTEVTTEQLEELQRIVNILNESYLATIAKGLNKNVDAIRAVADGRVIMAADAVKLGLIDGVQTYESTYGQLVAAVSQKPSHRSKPIMAEKTPATLAELKATFPNSTAEWRESQIEAGNSLSESAISYAKFVEAKAAEERTAHAKALEEAKAKAKEDAKAEADRAAASGSLGHKPLNGGNSRDIENNGSGDPVEDFNAAVAKIAGPRADLQRRQQAVRQVASRNPDLYRSYLLATNPGKKQSRLINEKLEVAGK